MIFLITQSGFGQCSVSTSFSCRISVGCPHTGQTPGGSAVPLCVRFSAIWGMIMFALYTTIRSPTPSFSDFTMLTLWTLARLTVVPSSSTGSNIATGLMSPVREGLHSISFKVVSLVSSVHLKAIAFRGNFAVVPRDSP